MRRLGLGQVGEEIEIVDDTEFDDLFGSAVVGNQIAAESREMGMVLQIDMHLLPAWAASRTASIKAARHCLRRRCIVFTVAKIRKKGTATSGPCKNTYK